MDPTTDLLARIRNVCNAYPENFIAGYIVSLIEGNPNEEILKSWKAKAEAPISGDTIVNLHPSVAAALVPVGDDASKGSEHTDPSTGVDDQPSSTAGCGELGPDGGTDVRRHGRAPNPKHNSRKTKCTTTKDVKRG